MTFAVERRGEPVLDIKEYLKQTRTVLVTQDAFDELVRKASAQPETNYSEIPNGWIPVTERLPKENGMYLVTMTEKAKAEELGFDLDEIEVSKMRYNSNGWQLPRHIPSWINEVVKDEVIAWMPLPEPYKGENDV